jgi:rRNA maturation protein Nop10
MAPQSKQCANCGAELIIPQPRRFFLGDKAGQRDWRKEDCHNCGHDNGKTFDVLNVWHTVKTPTESFNRYDRAITVLVTVVALAYFAGCLDGLLPL